VITREQVKDLQAGDVVRVSDESEGWTIEGSVWLDRLDSSRSTARCGPVLLRSFDGSPSADRDRVMGIVSRAPRPLYVNHPRTEPVAGDVAKDAAGFEPSGHTWHCLGDEESRLTWWRFDDRMRNGQPKVMRLLIDGETGEVVQ
jgi:hypothetical protein